MLNKFRLLQVFSSENDQLKGGGGPRLEKLETRFRDSRVLRPQTNRGTCGATPFFRPKPGFVDTNR